MTLSALDRSHSFHHIALPPLLNLQSHTLHPSVLLIHAHPPKSNVDARMHNGMSDAQPHSCLVVTQPKPR